MPDFDQVREIKARVQARLFGIRGVHAVGVGHKIVNSQPTSDVAIMVFVVKKKLLAELAPEEVIPAEIEGVKTDVYESDMPRRYERPLVGGIQLEPGGFLGGGFFFTLAGTLGFFARKEDPVPKIFAVTCYHVVGSPKGLPTELDVDDNGTFAQKLTGPTFATITFGGTNTPGTLVLVSLRVNTAGGPNTPIFDVFYVTTAADVLNSIASNVAARINAGSAIPGIMATFAGAVVTVQIAAGFDCEGLAKTFGPLDADRSARLQAFVHGNQISMAGIAADTGGAYVNVNIGGRAPTFGVFTSLAKGDTPPVNAQAVAKAVQSGLDDLRSRPWNANIPVVTATASGTQITITGGQEIECAVTTDVRVGQPTARFCSACSPCCDRRIGRVVAARLDLDAALIQLDPGLKYKAEIEGIPGPITGTKPVTVTGVGVRKRGSASPLTKGNILALDKDGDIIDEDPRKFGSHYTGAFSITPSTPGKFSELGDSGAAILDGQSNDIMGLLFGGTDKFSVAMPIDRILTTFGIVVETEAGWTEEQKRDGATVPGGAALSITEQDTTAVFAKGLAARLQEAHREIATTEAGAEFAIAVERHADEAQRLVNTNRRVATVWHRNGGPQIIQAVLGALQAPDRPLPQEIEGKPAAACLHKIQDIFTRYASAAFAADLSRLGPRIIELCGLSYNQMIAALQGTVLSE